MYCWILQPGNHMMTQMCRFLAHVRTPPPLTQEHNDFVPWTPESIEVMSEGGTPVGTPGSLCATPEHQIKPPVYQLDTP